MSSSYKPIGRSLAKFVRDEMPEVQVVEYLELSRDFASYFGGLRMMREFASRGMLLGEENLARAEAQQAEWDAALKAHSEALLAPTLRKLRAGELSSEVRLNKPKARRISLAPDSWEDVVIDDWENSQGHFSWDYAPIYDIQIYPGYRDVARERANQNDRAANHFFEWLVEELRKRRGPDAPRKKYYEDLAKRNDVSRERFRVIWPQAIKLSGSKLNLPGRPKKTS